MRTFSRVDWRFDLKHFANIITNTNPGNFLTDGVYVDQIPPAPAIAAGAPTGRICVDGTANWGPLNLPVAFTNPGTDGVSSFGNDTSSTHSLMLAALVAAPECTQFLGNRVDDGTSTAAVINLKDIAAATDIVLTAKFTGSLPNPVNGTAASAAVTLQSGVLTGSPVFALGISFPGFQQEQYSNIVGYAVAGSGFDAPTYKANVLAAVNAVSQNWTAGSSAGSAAPNTATIYSASGGTDGSAGVGSAQLIGSAALQTGIYAFSNQISGAQLLVANLTDGAVVGTLTAFATQYNCLVHIANVSDQSVAQIIAFRAANNISNASLVYSAGWDYFFDPIAGLQRLVNPSSKTAGVIAGQPAYMYPGNKPSGGVAGITATEFGTGNPTNAQGGQLEQNGCIVLTNNPNLFNSGTGYGLPHGLASDGVTLISDTRMLKAISFAMQSIYGPLVGQMQSQAANDPIRKLGNARANAYFLELKNGSPKQIDDYDVISDLSNNSQLTISQGKLIAAISVTTLSAVRFIVAMLQVGANVQIITQQAA